VITEIDDYFSKGCGRCGRFATADCSSLLWFDGQAELRRICLEAGLTEAVKWGHPCYMYKDRNIALMGALRDDFRLSFFNAALMQDPHGLLEKQGANTQHADVIRFTDSTQVTAMAHILKDYLQEAIGYAEAGLKAPKTIAEFTLQEELSEALDLDPELAEAFHSLTPGRQRSYVILLSSAKASPTRRARIARYRDHILAGKGANER
jgi:uncharacterized protein YdeI (YjbR/CyaY-like superfamily)